MDDSEEERQNLYKELWSEAGFRFWLGRSISIGFKEVI